MIFAAGAGLICVGLHIASYLTLVPPIWILVPFLLMMFSAICKKAGYYPALSDAKHFTRIGLGLLIYSVLLFLYVYKVTDGASSVVILDGYPVSMYKGHVIRTLTQREYLLFPNLWTRFMSAWIGMMAVFSAAT